MIKKLIKIAIPVCFYPLIINFNSCVTDVSLLQAKIFSLNLVSSMIGTFSRMRNGNPFKCPIDVYCMYKYVIVYESEKKNICPIPSFK